MKTILLKSEAEHVDRQIFSVSDLTRNIRFLLEQNFSGVWLEGEISNFKLHTSGHMYFSMKDEEAQIQCVMFRRENSGLRFSIEEGMKVLCFGRVSVYPIRGQYQLYVERLEPKGIGELQIRFEQLKERLRKEGFFDEARKKPIPYLPERIGIVTSIDGAALHDILNILDRRFPTIPALIYPVQVQGAGAAGSIAKAIGDLNELRTCDVMIVGRGGGSLEDLWAFNEEILARAIFDSKIPVISAVGHEVDFLIADFVADLRAPTPSAAAELVVPLKEELETQVLDGKARAAQAILSIFEVEFQRVDELRKNLQSFVGTFFKFQKERFLTLVGKLEALGPLATLRRGFSVTLKLPDGKIVRDSSQVKAGDNLRTSLSKGYILSQVRHTG